MQLTKKIALRRAPRRVNWLGRDEMRLRCAAALSTCFVLVLVAHTCANAGDLIVEAGSPLSGQIAAQNPARATDIPLADSLLRLPIPASSGGQPNSWQLNASAGNLRLELARWCKQAGYQYIWEVPEELEFAMDRSYQGSFEDAILELKGDLQASSYPLVPLLYSKNKVLRMVKTGDRK